MINVTKSFLPDINEYIKYLEGIWERGHLTNHGPLVNELEEKLRRYLGVKHFFFLNNGTIAIQIAIKALDLKGEIITTPFSYVATTSSIVWEQCKPVFVDIDQHSLTIDTGRIEQAITPQTTGILATHVYGIPCDVEAIEKIARKHNLKVIYDAAHAFGVKYKDQGLLNFGDISTLSFHATKLFHTVEGGGVATNDDALAHRISYLRNFGHNGQEEFWGLGVNGKSSEFHAAMGLCVLPHIDSILESRKRLSEQYDLQLKAPGLKITRPSFCSNTQYNYSYYPVVFDTEEDMQAVRTVLSAAEIFPRRYFFPSLNRLPYVESQVMEVAEDVSSKVLCLPLYFDLPEKSVNKIASIIVTTLNKNK